MKAGASGCPIQSGHVIGRKVRGSRCRGRRQQVSTYEDFLSWQVQGKGSFEPVNGIGRVSRPCQITLTEPEARQASKGA
jgi:hypothetical protein